VSHAVTVILPAPNGTAAEPLLAALDSVVAQAPAQTIVVTDGDDRSLARSLDERKDATLFEVARAAPAALRNAAWAKATQPFVLFVEPFERLAGKDVLARHAAALQGDKAAVASYGQTSIKKPSGPVVRPVKGKGGKIEKRLVQTKELIASAASVAWRKKALPAKPFDESYRSPSSILLSLCLSIAATEKSFAFIEEVVASADPPKEDLGSLEEKAKIFVALLFGYRPLGEKLEQRVRFRLARHLVAIGKHHYRSGDHVKAGKFFDEAVKSAPSYFKGRRYQFLNFVKKVFARTS
jgi:hypothetical protein